MLTNEAASRLFGLLQSLLLFHGLRLALRLLVSDGRPTRQFIKPSIDRLFHSLRHPALCRHVSTLSRQSSTGVSKATLIHSLLQRAVFPAKDIVAMLAIASSIVFLASFSLLSSQITHASPMLYTKGCEPSSGQRAASLKVVVSHMTSYMSCGICMGCVAGQGPLDSKEPVVG